jgi:hypothetical protein
MNMAMFPPNTVPLRMGLPGIAFPEYSQLPPPPVPPGGVGPEVYDLAILDTAAEALTMPGTSMMADLIIANQPSRQGRVTVQSGCQTLQYEVNPHNPCTQLQGQINGLPFAGSMSTYPGTVFTNANTPSGPIQNTTNYQSGVTNSKGKVNGMDYQQSYVVDPMSNFTGHLGIWSGTVGTSNFAIELTRTPDGQGANLSGYIGNQPLTGSMRKIDCHTYIIDRNVGGTLIRERVEV